MEKHSLNMLDTEPEKQFHSKAKAVGMSDLSVCFKCVYQC
ncbi:hypothetical protein RDI58_003203 [Solanum bulbocastanum]|uniref:Uncharacterized protein n=1 Tax=Solanum bulbocastanum TaxID=147425 RepID=A0AAN8UAU4_SOLBU